MKQVQTVRGPIAARDLGLTLSHEHLLTRPSPVNDPDLILDDPTAAAAELAGFLAAGGRTVLEVTPVDYGRNLAGLRALSEETGVHIVAATGLHKDEWSRTYTSRLDEDQLTALFTTELRDGVDGVKPGVIKVGSSGDRITDGERKVFAAAARTQRSTGVAITTHTEAGRLALEQVDLLIHGGADPERIVIGHLDRLLDIEYHAAVLREGANIGYDQVGKPKYASDRDRAAALTELVSRGYGAKLLISGDLGRRSYWRAHGGAPGLEYIPRTFLSILAAAGLTPAQAEALVVDNPARIFAYV